MRKVVRFISSVVLLMLCMYLTGCIGCDCTPENTLAMNNTTFNDQFECLDLNFLEKYNQSLSPSGYEYNQNYSNGYRKLYITKGAIGFVSYINIDHSKFLSIYKEYYPDGKIKKKGLYNDLGFRLGNWYTFNSSGSHIDTVDTEKGFDFTFEQLKEKLINEEKFSFEVLSPKSGGGGVEYPINIQKDTEGRPMWRVRYKDKDNSMNGIYGTEVEIYYDGKTGERISKDFIRVM